MRLLKSLFAAIIVFTCVIGCTSLPFVTDGREYKLGSKYDPLVSVEEGTDKLFAEGMTTTIGNHCYVPDLKEWHKIYPQGSVEEEAVLLHEQVHAKRQLSFKGTIIGWLAAYVANPAFRWQEEQLGYEAEIRDLYKNGRYINPDKYAVIFSHQYKSLGGQMVNYGDALAWVNDLIKRMQAGK